MSISPTKSAAPSDAPADPHHLKRRPAGSLSWKTILVAALVLGVVIWLGQLAIHAYRYVETDNAYLTGHLHSVSPLLEGRVQAVLVSDNQSVKAGDVLVQLDPLEFELAVQKSRAAVEQARAQENQTRAAAAQADALVTEAEARIKQAVAQMAQTSAP